MDDAFAAEKVDVIEQLLSRIKNKSTSKNKTADKNARTAKKAKEIISSELNNLRDDRELRELSERISLLESQGKSDFFIESELARRGISRSVAQLAMQVHLFEHPEHDIDERSLFSIDDRINSSNLRMSDDIAVTYKSSPVDEQAKLYSSSPDDLYKQNSNNPREAYESQNKPYENNDRRPDNSHSHTGLIIGGTYIRDDE